MIPYTIDNFHIHSSSSSEICLFSYSISIAFKPSPEINNISSRQLDYL